MQTGLRAGPGLLRLCARPAPASLRVSAHCGVTRHGPSSRALSLAPVLPLQPSSLSVSSLPPQYAVWEEQQNDLPRSRSVWERALDVSHRNVSVWLKYAEMEMRHKQINHARNVWDRAVSILPRIDQV